MWCTMRGQSLQYDAYRGAWLHGGMHSAKGYTLQSFLTPWYDAHSDSDEFWIMKKRGNKSRDTLPLNKSFDNRLG